MQAQQAQAMMSQFHLPPPPLFTTQSGQPQPFLPFRPPPGAAPLAHHQLPSIAASEHQLQG